MFAGLGVNDKDMADLIRMCYEGQDYIAALDLIPLTETWGPEPVEAEDTTIEDVERMIADAVPGTEFIASAVLYRLPNLTATFDLGRLTFGGAHPNCESATLLIADGQAYHPLSRYLKMPLSEMVRLMIEADRLLGKKLEHSLMARWFGRRGRQWVAGRAVLGLFNRTIRFKEVFGNQVVLKVALILWGLLRGVKLKDLLRRHTQCHNILRIMVLPFEETANLESERLKDCPASFAYEHPLTREIRFMPVCAWPVFKNQFLRETAQHYASPSPQE